MVNEEEKLRKRQVLQSGRERERDSRERKMEGGRSRKKERLWI